MSDTLSDFFDNQHEATLNDCDREPVHLSGAIQDIGGLLAIDQGSLNVVAATPGAGKIFGSSEKRLVGMGISSVHAGLQEELALLHQEEDSVHFSIEGDFERNGTPLDCIGHFSQGLWILEFFPSSSQDIKTLRSRLRRAGRDGVRVVNSDTLEEAAQIACECVRELTGFARVNIYQFLGDWSGKVIAEARADQMPAYLGLHFPASDIPRQARELYSMVPFRAIAGVHDENETILHDGRFGSQPLDLTRSLIRSVSKLHTAYLRNMGVEGSFSLGIMHEGRLWGLIACHADTPGLPAYDIWTLSREIGNSLAAFLKRDEQRQSANMIVALREIERALSKSLELGTELPEVMKGISPKLLELLDADGFAFKHGGEIQLSGNTPPIEFVRELVDWLPDQGAQDLSYCTTSLHLDWDKAREYMETACGVLVQPIRPKRMYYMIWFRAPHAETVYWAGEPTAKFEPAEARTTGSLQPRESFEAWRANGREASREWTNLQQRAASDSLREVLTVIAEMSALGEENAMLKSFAAAAAHDIKAPLRGIDFALSVMEEEGFEREAVKEFHDIAVRSTSRLSDLTQSLVELGSLDRDSISRDAVNLEATLEEIRSLLVFDVRRTNARIDIDPIPGVPGERALLQSLFLNLVSNAMKFAREGHPPEVRIKGATVDDASMVEIRVTDNGVGIPADKVESIFKPLTRLYSSEEFEGAGLGLAICRRIAELHGGTIHAEPRQGVGSQFVIRLPTA
jgi:chemotaxis family two-component system sensor kinase Cph1